MVLLKMHECGMGVVGFSIDGRYRKWEGYELSQV
jgi:hypothetical protein